MFHQEAPAREAQNDGRTKGTKRDDSDAAVEKFPWLRDLPKFDRKRCMLSTTLGGALPIPPTRKMTSCLDHSLPSWQPSARSSVVKGSMKTISKFDCGWLDLASGD